MCATLISDIIPFMSYIGFKTIRPDQKGRIMNWTSMYRINPFQLFRTRFLNFITRKRHIRRLILAILMLCASTFLEKKKNMFSIQFHKRTLLFGSQKSIRVLWNNRKNRKLHKIS